MDDETEAYDCAHDLLCARLREAFSDASDQGISSDSIRGAVEDALQDLPNTEA